MEKDRTIGLFIAGRFVRRFCPFVVALMFTIVPVGSARAELDQDEQAKVDTLATLLQLSAKQKAAVAKEREKSKHALVQLEKKWQRLHDDLRREVRKNVPDQAAVDRISGEIGKIQGEMVALRTGSLIYLKSQLTPEQLKIIQDRPEDASAGSGK
jgi:hypothetical protein